MSNIGLKPNDGTNGKLITFLEREIANLKNKMYILEKKIEQLENHSH